MSAYRRVDRPHRPTGGALQKTRELYDRLLAAAREKSPPNISYIAEQCGVGRKAVRTALYHGWDGVAWARPIGAVVEEEARAEETERRRAQRDERARADRERREAAEAQRAADRQERAKDSAEELLVVRACRGAVRQLATTVMQLATPMKQFVKVVERAVYDEQVGVDGRTVLTPKASPDVTPDQAMKWLRTWSSMVGRVALAGDVSVKLGRDLRGPDEVEAGPEMSPEAAREDLDYLAAMWSEIKAREAPQGALGDGLDEDDDGGGSPPPLLQ